MTSGLLAMTGAIWLFQQDAVSDVLKLQECQDAVRLPLGSLGSY
ncbi:hypothetical protein ABT173_33390 [Streptomyces sp. NPDC001795]